MKLKVLGSSSAGNCYLFEASNGETLIVDCGLRFEKVKQALDYNLRNVVGTLLTHSHGDHSKGIPDIAKNGIRIYTSKETAKEIGMSGHHRIIEIEPRKKVVLKSFEIVAFDVEHKHTDERRCRCYGYLIKHEECGLTCFITDTYYVPFFFPGLNNIIVEANYDKKIVDAKLLADKKFLRDRILASHMELQTTIKFLLANDLTEVNHIVLIHLSDGNSNAADFQRQVELATQKHVTVADAGTIIELNKTPF
jgi:phosphoribosyl 1,2-cyclic phosphodiesterase